MLHINNAQAKSVFSIGDCMEALEEAYVELAHGRAFRRPKMEFFTPCLDQDALYEYNDMLGAVLKTGYLAHRIKSDITSWPVQYGSRREEKYCMRPGNYCGLIILFSIQNGEPLALIQDGYIQHLRVGAGAGLMAKYAARSDAKIVGVIGSGGMAKTYLQAMCVARQIKEARVYSPNVEHRRQYAIEMSQELGIEVKYTDNHRAAVKGTDIVCVATDSINPFFQPEWLEPGMHVACIKTRRELHKQCEDKADFIIQVDLPGAPQGAVRIIDPGAEEFIDERQVHVTYILGADKEEREKMKKKIPSEWREIATHLLPKNNKVVSLLDLLTGTAKARTSSEQTSLSQSGGTANSQGVNIAGPAGKLYERARERSIGRELPLEWFTQTVKD